MGLGAHHFDEPLERFGDEPFGGGSKRGNAARSGAPAEVGDERPIVFAARSNRKVQVRREPGSSIGTLCAHCGHSVSSYDSSGICNSATVGTPKSAVPRTTIAPTPATCAPVDCTTP